MFKRLLFAILLFCSSVFLSLTASFLTKGQTATLSKCAVLIFGVLPFLIYAFFNKTKEKRVVLNIKLPSFSIFFSALFIANIFAYFESFLGFSEKAAQTFEFSPHELFVLVFFSVLAVPLVEEFIFRKNLFVMLNPIGTLFATLVSSLMFSCVHPFGAKAYAFIMGCALALIYAAYGFGRSFMFHMVNNALNISVSYFSFAFGDKVGIFYNVFIIFSGIVSVFVLIKKI